jgi:hypothetical protein
MSAAYIDGHYKPIRTCKQLKECNKNQASLDADEMRSLRSLANNINEHAKIHNPDLQLTPLKIVEEVNLRPANETLNT